MATAILLLVGLLSPQVALGWSPTNVDSQASISRSGDLKSAVPQISLGGSPTNVDSQVSISRRDALKSAAIGSAFVAKIAFADDTPQQYRYEVRDRNNNKDAVIREDFWYTKGVTPPRRLNSPLVLDNPQWNTFGCKIKNISRGFFVL